MQIAEQDIVSYEQLNCFTKELHAAATYFNDSLDAYTRISCALISDKNARQCKVQNGMTEWFTLAANKHSKTPNATYLSYEHDTFFIFVESDEQSIRWVDLEEELFDEARKNLKIVINNMPFSLKDAFEYIQCYKDGKNRPERFSPVFNAIKVISPKKTDEVNIKLLENALQGASTTEIGIENPELMNLPDGMHYLLEDIQESLDALSVRPDFFRMAGITADGVPAIGLYSDARILQYTVKEFSETYYQKEDVYIRDYDLPPSKTFSVDVYAALESNIESMKKKMLEMFIGDIPDNVQIALSEFESRIKRY